MASKSLLNNLYPSLYQTYIPSSFSRVSSREKKIKDYSDPCSLIYVYNVLLARAFRKFKDLQNTSRHGPK